MDFAYPPETEAFRREVRAWLEENLDEELRTAGAPGMPRFAENLERLRDWNRRLAEAGYAAISWPTELSGRDAGVVEQVVLAEEMSRLDAPGPLNPIGISNIAPAIMQYGTEEQKRTLLPRMLRGDDIWCQGFSEPDSGSDLASLKTRAVLEGDHFVVNGQKVWNTLGDVADWCELLVRTDPEAPPHRGLSCLLLDMRSAGVEVRPLVTLTGESEFNEIFLSNVRVPAGCLLGPLNEGWSVALHTLTHERSGIASLHLGVRKKVLRLIEEVRSAPAGGEARDPSAPRQRAARQSLAQVYLEAELLRLLSDRAVSAELNGETPGPEGSLLKLLWSNVERDLSRAAGEVLGTEAQAGYWAREQLYSLSCSIAGGTTEVNKNIVAERILGLPRA
jgi:alkylation response protein AidB-like acyl-CoA dehydrogenase